MNNNKQIIAAYENSDGEIGVEEIAENLGYEIEAVKQVLLMESPLYRRKVRTGVESDLTNDETKEALEVLQYIMRTHKDSAPGVAAKAAMYIRNEGKGRNDIKAIVGNGVNINIINARLQGMKAAKARVYGEIKDKETIEADIVKEDNNELQKGM